MLEVAPQVFRWSGRRLTVEGQDWWYMEIAGAHELPAVLLDLTGHGDSAGWPPTVMAFEREIVAPLGAPPFTISSAAIDQWVEKARTT